MDVFEELRNIFYWKNISDNNGSFFLIIMDCNNITFDENIPPHLALQKLPFEDNPRKYTFGFYPADSIPFQAAGSRPFIFQ